MLAPIRLVGVLLWLFLRWSRRTGREMPPGTFGGLFLLGYGAVRSVLEQFRQPDVQFTGAGDPLGTVLGPLTMGQTLSLGMMLVGGAVLVRGLRVRGATKAEPGESGRGA